MKVSTTSERLKAIMLQDNLKQVDILNKAQPICRQYGIKLTKADLSQYVSGKVEPGQEKLFILSQALGVNVSWLMGWDVPMRGSENPRVTYVVKTPDSDCDFIELECTPHFPISSSKFEVDPSLIELDIHGNEKLTEDGTEILWENIRTLKDINPSLYDSLNKNATGYPYLDCWYRKALPPYLEDIRSYAEEINLPLSALLEKNGYMQYIFDMQRKKRLLRYYELINQINNPDKYFPLFESITQVPEADLDKVKSVIDVFVKKDDVD